MITATVREARLNLSRLLHLVQEGQEVTIQNRHAPVARLVPMTASTLKAFPDLAEFRRKLAGRVPRHGRSAEELVRADREGRD